MLIENIKEDMIKMCYDELAKYIAREILISVGKFD